MTRSFPWLTALLQTVILLSVAAFATPWLVAFEGPLPTPRRSGDITISGHQARPIYNGSVVPGGVYSLDELRAAVERDPIVAAHYRGARLGDMRAVTLTAGKAAYVSYRVGNRIHWTRNRVWLKPGETVLTDGTTTVRARCGNCVSDVKQDDVAAVEPAHGELDEFVVPATGASASPAEAEAGLGELLQVPFASESLASLGPGGPLLPPDLLATSFGNRSAPVFGVPPFLLPGGGGGGGVPVPPGGVVPPVPPVPFVPPATTTGESTTDTTGSTSTVTSTGDLTGESSTGFTSGSSGTGFTSGGTSTGSPTDTLTTGTSSETSGVTEGPTTGGVTTSANTTGAAPEPEVLWLLATGVIGLARRHLRAR